MKMQQLVLIGLGVGAGISALIPQGPNSGWKKVVAGGYLPPNMNGTNLDHKCDLGSGICVAGPNTCEQRWQDNNGTGAVDALPPPADTVSCWNTNPGAW